MCYLLADDWPFMEHNGDMAPMTLRARWIYLAIIVIAGFGLGATVLCQKPTTPDGAQAPVSSPLEWGLQVDKGTACRDSGKNFRSIRRQWQIGVHLEKTKGRPVRVISVEPSSPAEQAGVIVGDRILAVGTNDYHIVQIEHLRSWLQKNEGHAFPLRIRSDDGGDKVLQCQPELRPALVETSLVDELAQRSRESWVGELPAASAPDAGVQPLVRLPLDNVCLSVALELYSQFSGKELEAKPNVVTRISVAVEQAVPAQDYLLLIEEALARQNIFLVPTDDGKLRVVQEVNRPQG